MDPEEVQEIIRKAEKMNAEKFKTLMEISKSKKPVWIDVVSDTDESIRK